MKVFVFQWPNGALERSRWPLGHRPRRRVIFVVVPCLIEEDQAVRLKRHPRLPGGPTAWTRQPRPGRSRLRWPEAFFFRR